ncbi:MAG TPA: PIN domain-containing protein [Terriglobales bacterium]|jgi:uncharacterized protein|nr:PIN domain-containing protein [Terriglobales bacterium]
MKAIADTGMLVAMLQQKDQFHPWAAELAKQITWPALTCEPVLAETAFHLRSSAPVLEMLKENVIQVAFDCASHLEQLLELAVRYADLHPDLADLCLIRMSELYPRHTLITVDKDFRVYRRNKREAIPAIYPPKLLS